jgi:multiple sugar transport system ATP-binding protein
MDEPLSNLDAQLRVQTRSELVKLQRRLQATVIYVTHDQTEAMTMADRVAVMRGGVLQQFDGPQQIYDFPANRFVAGFVGSPGMNFFEGRLTVAGGASVKTASFTLPIQSAEVGEPRDRAVVVGVRPEDILVGDEVSTSDPSVFTATADVIEPLGSEKLLHLIAAEERFVARVDPRLPVQVGDRVSCAIRVGRAHLFDAETGDRLPVDLFGSPQTALPARG